jgi:hypothetical protein
MSELLKDKLPNPFATDYQYSGGPLDLYTEDHMLRYAKWVIQECINVLETHDIPQDSPLMHQIINDRYRTSTQYGNIIKEHFRVK